MKFFISIILVAIGSFAACLILPWWSIAIVAFLIAVFIPQTPSKSFIAGFLGAFLLWAGLSFYISSLNEHLFAHKISMLLIKVDNPFLLIIITGIIGGLVAGLGSLTGSFIKLKK
ncbi:hypothetical protein ACFOWM_02185 [Ferruginibacter yonginensis]|uniref:Uncharacterized protein n=1 Tax=Ferruginibacter yonginensis TaxID=1310416 RepID=A0ABV8QMZ6_9BACT